MRKLNHESYMNLDYRGKRTYDRSLFAYTERGTQFELTTGFSKMSITSSMALVSGLLPTRQCVIMSLAYLNDFVPASLRRDAVWKKRNGKIMKYNRTHN